MTRSPQPAVFSSSQSLGVLNNAPGQLFPDIVPLQHDGLESAIKQGMTSADQRQHLWTGSEEWLISLAPLVAPIAERAAPGEFVWIVPHESLHYVPLHALPFEGRPLGDRNPVCYTPNVTTLWHCRNRAGIVRGRVLIIADPGETLPALRQHNDLRIEAFGADNVTIMLGPDATRPKIERVLREDADFSIIHFGCHGVFDHDDPLSSGLLLASDGNSPARWTAHDFLAVTMNADLVVLAACDTGVNASRPGDDLIGLTRSILYAGAKSVLVSLWPVDQTSTSLLLSAFYTELSQGVGKANALRTAQLNVRNITAEDIVLDCSEKLARIGEGPDRNWLVMRKIRAREAARDYAEALRECDQLAGALTVNDPLASDVRRAAARCRRAIRHATTLDYGAQPYKNPYYWAAFVLVGEWL